MDSEVSNQSDSIKVFVRVRPPAENVDKNTCLVVTTPTTLILQSKSDPKDFTFDHVVDQDASQDTVFQYVGKRIVDGCIEGYNGTIFAYGQTGSGKTFTMLGESETFADNMPRNLRGIIPRSVEYLFELIERKQDMHGKQVDFLCKCSFLEIYNEHVYDLLDPSPASSLQIRESLKRGVFVDGIIESSVTSASQAIEVLKQGWNYRHVAATSMNRESSRSHAVFTICIEAKDKTGEITKVRQSLLNLVDLAGSERQRDTGASGARLREAGSINRSLSVFGNVIMSLVDINKGKTRHVPYRDSKLTFLLRDSIGGNARTYIIANVHPSSSCVGETLSTLYFAQRAKMIKNQARINEDTQGDVVALQNEIRRLKVMLMKSNSDGVSLDNRQSCMNEDYENKFMEMVEVCKQESVEIEELHFKLGSVQSVVQKLEKALLSMRMIVKLRDSTIKKLLKKNKEKCDDETDAQLNKQIEVLSDQICGLPQAALQQNKIEELHRMIKRLQALPNAQAFYQLSTTRKESLLEEYQKLVKQRKNVNGDNGVQASQKQERDMKISELEKEFTDYKKSKEEEHSQLKNRLESLVQELSAAKNEKEELEKLLKSSQDDARAHVKRLNTIHDTTINLIATPKKSLLTSKGRKRGHLDEQDIDTRSSKQLKTFGGDLLNNSLSDNENVIPLECFGDVHDIDDDVSAMAYKMELESEREERTKATKQAQQFERENVTLRQKLTTSQGRLDATQNELSSLQNLNALKVEESAKAIEDFQKRLNNLTEDNKLKSGEVEDLRITLASADRELAEKKQVLMKLQESTAKEISSLRNSCSEAKEQLSLTCNENERFERRIQTLEEENDKAVTELNFTRDQMSELKCTVQKCKEDIANLETELKLNKDKLAESKKLYEGTQLERRLACDELTKENEKLRNENSSNACRCSDQENMILDLQSELQTSKKTIVNDKKAMSSLLEQVNELRGASSLRDIVEDELRIELRECNDKLQDVMQSLEAANTKVESYEEALAASTKNSEDLEQNYKFKMENLQDDLTSLTEHFTALTDDLAEKESLVESLKNSEENRSNEIRQDLSELETTKQRLIMVTEERDKLANEAAKLAGHSNHLQKIHYLNKLKEDFHAVQEENQTLRASLRRYEQKMGGKLKQRSLSPSSSR